LGVLLGIEISFDSSVQVSEKEAQRKELEERVEQLEARLAPLDADKAELAGRLNGLEKRLREGTFP
jgi:chaperonin cofactor prefoldin